MHGWLVLAHRVVALCRLAARSGIRQGNKLNCAGMKHMEKQSVPSVCCTKIGCTAIASLASWRRVEASAVRDDHAAVKFKMLSWMRAAF